MSTTKIFAMFNQAGGVAKTTCTMNLGYHLAKRSQRVLLIDMDGQSSLTDFMGYGDNEVQTAYESVIEETPLPIVKNVHGMDLVCSDVGMCHAEVLLTSIMMREFRLKQAIEPVLANYDYILIDCPPSLGILSIMSLVAATHVIIPVETHYKALKGLEKLFDTLASVRKGPNRNLKIGAVIPTKYNTSTNQGSRCLATLNDDLVEIGIVTNAIPQATAFTDASEKHMPLAVLDPKHKAVGVLDEITQILMAL